MSEAVKKLLPAVMALTPAERDELFDYFDEPCEDVSPEEIAEWDRRFAEMKSGRVPGIPLDEAVRILAERQRARG